MPLSARDFQSIVGSAPGPRVVLDRAYTIVAANDAFLRVTGRARAATVGRSIFEVFPEDPEALDGPRSVRASLQRLFSTGQPDRLPVTRYDLARPGRQGAEFVERHWERLSYPVLDNDGRVMHVIHELEDVTEFVLLRQREAAATARLVEARSVYQAIYDQGIFAGRLDLSGTLIDANRTWLEACGFTREEVVGKPFWDCGWWNRSSEVQAWVRAAVGRAHSGEAFRGVSPYFMADGSERVVEFACVPIKDETGHVIFLLPTGIDITERVRVEREQRATAILESITDAFFSLDRQWRFTYLNAQAEPHLLRKRGELLGKVVWEEFPAAIGTKFEREYHSAMTERRPVTFEEYYPAPLDGWYEVNAYPTEEGLAVYFRDVTARRRAEEALADARSRAEQQAREFDATLSAVQDFVFAFDRDLRVRYANRILLDLWGLPAEAALGKTLDDLGYPVETREQVTASVRRVLDTGRTVSAEVAYRNPAGTLGYYDYTLGPVFDAAGAVVRVAGSARDTTARRAAEEAVTRSEQRFRALVTATSDVVYRVSPDWSEMHWLQGRELVADTSERGRTWLETYVHPGDRARVLDAIAQAVRDKGDFELEHRVVRVDGTVGWTFSRAVPILDERGEVVEWCGMASDVTPRKEAEAERERLKEDSDRQRRVYEAALSNTPDLVYIFDLGHRFTYANEALLAMWGRSREDAIGKNCLELGYETWHAAMHDREIDEVVATRKPVRGVVPFTGTYGRRIYDYIFAPVLGADSSVVAVAGTTRDVTDAQEAEQALRRSEGRLAAALAIADLGTFEWDVRTDALTLDDRSREIFGFAPGEGTRAQEIFDRIEPSDFGRVLALARASQDSLSRLEIEYRVHPPGRAARTVVSISEVVPGADGRAERMLGVFSDVTARRRDEEALRDANRRKDEFLAMLAHELRNPLSAIGNAIQLVRRSEAHEHLEWAKDVISKQVNTLSRMMDDLLDVSRITRGKIVLRKQNIDVGSIAAHAAETVRPLVEERNHELTLSVSSAPMRVVADPTRLEQVVVNLLVNAAKYTDPGGKIVLTAEALGEEVAISVRDDGSGIPPQQIPQMFELFAQGDRSIARSEGGLGIGLTLVKSLVEMHGGSIAARSDGPGTGSEFTVRLPAAPPPPAERGGEERGQTDRVRDCSTVLVVDDNVDSARGLVRLLRVLGHEVEEAFDGPSAIEAARRHRPDFILLDIGLPGMDGYEVAERLRAEGFNDAVIIAVSGYGEEAARSRSRVAGFDHHLVKPIDYDKLLRIMQRAQGADGLLA